MTSITLKSLLAGLAAVAITGAAVAQSTPPNPAAKDPAVGAGQQSTTQTPMGATGTPAGGSTAAGSSGSSGSSPSTMGASGTTSGSTGSSSSMGASGSTTTTETTTTQSRTARADRN